ncbi:hypothetical protein Bpfe_029633 [Biomphalaria pfeifferi]|uniref:Uncharacterized protein n=1 Tax=Biomphalaria pfeifferi TaxID=112525 RepID=A0AAD8EVQ9_BIOPF|nr:hypothetical protein Bpfe_029633 [Biomphalaria pfeifferi]
MYLYSPNGQIVSGMGVERDNRIMWESGAQSTDSGAQSNDSGCQSIDSGAQTNNSGVQSTDVKVNMLLTSTLLEALTKKIVITEM